MNPSREERDEPSSEGASSSRSATDCSDRELAADSCSSTSGESPQDMMKRAAAKRLIERYFYQLVDGCGNSHCSNKFCASSGETRNLTPNEAAAEAIKLFYNEAKLCDTLPTKVPRTGASPSVSAEASASKVASSVRGNGLSGPKSREANTSQSDGSEGCSSINRTLNSSQTITQVDGPCNNKGGPLTEERLCQLCKDCLETNIPEPLIVALGEAICQPHILARCFPCKVNEEIKSNRETHGQRHSKTEKAKELREVASSSDPDKDVDSVTGPGLDVAACKRAFKCLSQLPSHYYDSIISTALTILSENLKLDLRVTKSLSTDDVVNCFLIAFEMPVFSQSEHMDVAVQTMCRAAVHLPVKAQAKLARMWAHYCKDSLRNILVCLQQFITLRVVSTPYTFSRCIQRDDAVVMATKVMKILYYANMLAGDMELSTLREEPIDLPIDPLGDALEHLYPLKHLKQPHPEDPLGLELDVNALDCRKPYLPFEDFYNEPLCDNVEMDKDFSFYKSEFGGCRHTEFAFLLYPFILTAGTKSLGLYYDNRIRMYSERRASMLHAVVGAAQPVPFLRLKVRRTHIIDDALVELEVISMERAVDLKKQLVVEFEGEQGVDEGGVSKEFFQLVVEEIFNPDYGMFTDQPDSHTVWFNPTSFETEAQFTLIGIVLGLAIYNNVILAVNFPMVVYRKLLGKKGSFEDLADWNPVLYNSLKSILEYQGGDMEEVFVQTFRICYSDVFGNNIFHDLKPDGDNTLVNQENKQEFVELYSDFLLNKSVETQFRAFRRGFAMVTDESPLGAWFRPEELETLVCGSKNFDFNELEKSTEYDGGYTSETQIVKDFWSIVHSLTLENKRKLLQFTTGSDRVPIGGLSQLKLIIARNGPDCDRLPTAHTCFNVLLLPEYDTKEKLNDRLMKAISYSKGFGML